MNPTNTQTTKDDIGHQVRGTVASEANADPTIAAAVVEGEFRPATSVTYSKTTVPVTTTYQTTTEPVNVQMGQGSTATQQTVGSTQATYRPAETVSHQQTTVPVTTTYQTETKPVDVKMGSETTRQSGNVTTHAATTDSSKAHHTTTTTSTASSTSTEPTMSTSSSHHTSIGERIREGIDTIKEKVSSVTHHGSSNTKA